MEKIVDFLRGAGGVALIGAFIVPDWIAGVNKAMRMGKAAYPKEARKKKWTWIGIFVLVGCVLYALSYLLEKLA